MNKKLLIDTLNIQSKSFKEEQMAFFINYKLTEIKNLSVINKNKNIYVTKGVGKYICLASHMDTMQPICNNFKIYENGNWLFSMDINTNQQIGIGGDDKVGVFICLYLLQILDNIKVVFFSNEEVGLIGASKCDLHFFDDCHSILESDRQGNNDFIRKVYGIELFDKKFGKLISPIIKKYAYKFNDIGRQTDVVELKRRGLKIPVANLSCGYYNPHTDYETVNVADVQNCINLIKEIFLLF